jgi:hypothetical protein
MRRTFAAYAFHVSLIPMPVLKLQQELRCDDVLVCWAQYQTWQHEASRPNILYASQMFCCRLMLKTTVESTNIAVHA